MTRGPFVLCAEEADNEGAVQRFYLPELPKEESCSVAKIEDGVLTGSPIISIPVVERVDNESRQTEVNFIPYFSWNNRGNASMIVWLPIQHKVPTLSYLVCISTQLSMAL